MGLPAGSFVRNAALGPVGERGAGPRVLILGLSRPFSNCLDSFIGLPFKRG